MTPPNTFRNNRTRGCPVYVCEAGPRPEIVRTSPTADVFRTSHRSNGCRVRSTGRRSVVKKRFVTDLFGTKSRIQCETTSCHVFVVLLVNFP